MKKGKKLLSAILCTAMVFTSLSTPATTAKAAGTSVKSITLNVKPKVTMYRGSTKTIKVASVSPKAASKKVKFKSSAPAVVKVSSKGAMKALKSGKATITVTSSSNRKVTKKVKVTVKNLVKNTTEDKVVIPLDKKKTLKMSLAVKASNLTFTSSKKSVAVVDKKGVVKAKKAGTAKITVKGKKGAAKGAKQTVTVYVAKKSVKSVSINVKKKVLKPGKTFTLKTKVNPSQAANVVTYKSSKPSVATVSSKGKVKAVKVGTAKITAITIDGRKKAVCTVVVAKKTSQTEPTTAVKPTTAKPTTKPSETTKEDTTTKSSETTKEEPTTKPSETTKEEPTTKLSETTREDVTTAKPGETTKKEDTTTKADETTTSKQESTTTAKQEGTTTSKQESTTTAKQEGTTTSKQEETTKKEETTTAKQEETTKQEETSATAPLDLEDLEEKYPEEPKYEELDLSDSEMEVELKDDLLALDVPAGTKVKTKGYYKAGDGGQASYEIMTYDDWWEQLPLELKVVHYHNNRIGAGQVLYKNPADNYGNHRLNNGMVAKLLPNEDGYVRVEQWGLFPGRDDNNRALIHIFANNHTNSKILFGKDAHYVLHYDTKNQAYQNKNGVIDEIPWWLGVDSIGNNGNEYAVMLHCRQTSKPVIGDAQNVELCGNGCTITIPDNEFCKGSTADFAMFETGGYVDGLKIHGFNFDSNGLNQYQYYDESKEEYVQMRTTNHTISYFTGGLNLDNSSQPLKDGNGKEIFEEITGNDLKNYVNRDKTCFNNVEIYGNTFLANGTSVNISDGGGDDILIINPEQSENVSIHNNKMYNWGRWVFAVDLGGEGERFYNYSFKQNICIQDNTNVTCTVDGATATPTTSVRGLGWIDFEARKCFTNLDVSENYVYGANGWAFNGNGKISDNITINANTIERPAYPWRSIYPYAFTFYSVYAKDLKVTNNKITNGGSIGWGNLAYNFLLENNDLGSASFGITRPVGSVIIRNNTSTGVRNQSYSINTSASLPFLEDETSEYYLPPEERKADILFEGNSTGGVVANIVVQDTDNDYRKNITLTFKDNQFAKFVVNAIGIKDFYFTPDQLTTTDMAWAARGCKYSSPVTSRAVDNPVPGGLYYKEGDLITSTLDKVTRLYNPYYFTTLFPQLKNDNGSIKKDQDMYCTKEGVLPLNGEFLNADADAYFTANKEYGAGTFIYTEDNLYYVVTKGTTGDTVPTHVKGTEKNGTAELMWVAPIARYEMRDKVTQ